LSKGSAFELYSKQFPLLLSKKFDNIIEINNILLKAQDILVINTKKIYVETLDGCKLEWCVYNTTRKETRIYMSSSKEPLRCVYKKKLNTEVNKKKQNLTFIVGVIHSIDSAIVRLCVNKMYSRKNYSIQHLHDSFSMHPNFVSEFNECLHYIFTSGEYFNPETLNKLFFNPGLSILPADSSQQALKDLKKECFSLRTMNSDHYSALKHFVIQKNLSYGVVN
jgi:hypothetical protein